MRELEFTVPLAPPSVNHYKMRSRDGHYYVTDEATAFKQAVAVAARGRRVRQAFHSVEIYRTLGPKQRLDLDNCAKVVLDGLAEGGQIHSDAAVTMLVLHKRRGERPETFIAVWEGDEP